MKTIRIGNKEVNARSSALTSKIYRQLFDKDLMTEMASTRKRKDATIIEMFRELAFVMAWQAQERNEPISQAVKRLSVDDYIDWIDQFEDTDFFAETTIAQITEIWLGNSKSLINAKNHQSQQ